MKHKGALGNGQGRAVDKALEHAEAAVEEIAEMNSVMQRMNDKQRRLFVALSRGKDELQASLEAGYTEWFTGISKVLDIKEEYWSTDSKGNHKKTMKTEDLTLKTLYLLADYSYEKILTICQNRVAKQNAGTNYRDYITSINDFLQLIAPDAYAVIGDIMLDTFVKPEVRLKAASDLLDRAGYKDKAGSGNTNNPVQVNIVLPGQPDTIHAEVVSGN